MSEPIKKTASKKTAAKGSAVKQTETKPAAKKSVKTAAVKVAAKKTAKAAGTLSATPSAEAARHEPTHEQISRRAYEIHASRGHHHASQHDDWAQAEAELKAR